MRALKQQSLPELFGTRPVRRITRVQTHNVNWSDFDQDVSAVLVPQIANFDDRTFSLLRELASLCKCWRQSVSSFLDGVLLKEPRAPDSFGLDYEAICDALRPRVYTDDELDMENYMDDGHFDQDYANLIRALRIVECCTAEELKVLIVGRLVANRKDYTQEYNTYKGKYFNMHLIEVVMPDIDKMRVCLENGTIDVHTSNMSEIAFGYGFYYGDDMICSYMHNGGHDIDAVHLLLEHTEYECVYEEHVAQAGNNGLDVTHPGFFGALVAIAHL